MSRIKIYAKKAVISATFGSVVSLLAVNIALANPVGDFDPPDRSASPTLRRADIERFGDPFSKPLDKATTGSSNSPEEQNHGIDSHPPNKADNLSDPPEMKAEWDVWHKRVADAIELRFQKLSNGCFRNSSQLQASAQYEITSDARVVNVTLVQKSSSPVFDTILVAVIRSVSNDLTLLKFPVGSSARSVVNCGTFVQKSSGPGFRYISKDCGRM